MSDTDTIDNSADIIDSRDIISRIEYLESLLQVDCDGCGGKGTVPGDGVGEVKDCPDCSGVGTVDAELDGDERTELAALQSLAEEASGYASDWSYGETLIRDSYFEDYAREMADDIGAIDRNAKWPLNHIDWNAAADELKGDYTSVDFDGVDYWIRS